jgi:hypothetical protein
LAGCVGNRKLRKRAMHEDFDPKPKFIWNFWTVLGIIEMALFILGAELVIFKCLFGWKF